MWGENNIDNNVTTPHCFRAIASRQTTMRHLTIIRLGLGWRTSLRTSYQQFNRSLTTRASHGDRFRVPPNLSLALKRYKFTTPATGLTDSGRLLIDSIKKRQPKKKQNIAPNQIKGLCERSVVALSTAEEYQLESIREAIIEQGLYDVVSYPDEDAELEGDVLHLTAKYKVNQRPREFFIFREGSIVFWNMLQSEVCYSLFVCLVPNVAIHSAS